MFLGNLVQDLAGLRQAAVLGLQSLQAEHHKLEEEIRKAQERHQRVRGSRPPAESISEACSRFSAGRASRELLLPCLLGQVVRLVLRKPPDSAPPQTRVRAEDQTVGTRFTETLLTQSFCGTTL